MKHTPATPLPWRALPKQEESFPVECAEGSRFVRLHYAHGVRAQHDAQRENAAYIVHAANAYPRLVEALRNLSTGVPAHEDYYRAQALLRELGEAA